MRLPEPINSNQARGEVHHCYIAATGGGKTTYIIKGETIPKSGAQVVFFDPYRNYAGKRFKGQEVKAFTEFAPFYRHVLSCRAAGKPFKAALVKPATPENIEIYAAMVWAMGDGKAKTLYNVMEEFASAADTTAKLKGKAGELFRGGRQFGIENHVAFQRLQEVPKTVISQSGVWWCGAMDSRVDAVGIAKQRGVDVEMLCSLKPAPENAGLAEYVLIKKGIDNYKRGEIRCFTPQKAA